MCIGRAFILPSGVLRAEVFPNGRSDPATLESQNLGLSGSWGERPIHQCARAAHPQVWKRATSLGGIESLIDHRASIEGLGSPCPSDLLRLSVGLEDADDLLLDLIGALER